MFDWLFKRAQSEEKEKQVIGIEFHNTQATKLILWIELACIEIELEYATEYRIESDETEYLLEFNGDHITLFLQRRFGPKVLKRPHSPGHDNKALWEIEIDNSDY